MFFCNPHISGVSLEWFCYNHPKKKLCIVLILTNYRCLFSLLIWTQLHGNPRKPLFLLFVGVVTCPRDLPPQDSFRFLGKNNKMKDSKIPEQQVPIESELLTLLLILHDKIIKKTPFSGFLLVCILEISIFGHIFPPPNLKKSKSSCVSWRSHCHCPGWGPPRCDHKKTPANIHYN